MLDHVGFTSAIPGEGATGADEEAGKAVEPPGFTGNAPGGPSRWSTERTGAMGAAEARAGGRGAIRSGHRPTLPPRHGIPALAAGQGPRQCTFDQLAPELGRRSSRNYSAMSLLFDEPLIAGFRYEKH